MTKIAGLTGGIGSGKTTVAKMFEHHGVPIYISDQRAKDIMESPQVVEQVQALFDIKVTNKDGLLDRALLREVVFADKVALQGLNNIVHPLVKKDFESWLETHKDKDFVIKESAILFEKELHKQCDFVILVTAPESVRIDRVVKRDGVSSDNIRQIITNQLKDVIKIPLSDFVIENVDIELVKEQVKCIVNRIKFEKDSF